MAARRIGELEERMSRMQQAGDELRTLRRNAHRRSEDDDCYCIEHQT